MDSLETPLRADILARLLLVQSTAGHLTDERSIVDFACRGLEMIPGVDKVRNVLSGDTWPESGIQVERFPLRFGGSAYGDVLVKLNAPELFAPYAPHVQNLLYVIGLMLEERRQRRLAEAYRQDLEQRVSERTLQLSHEVEERRLAEERALAAMTRAEDYLAISEAIIVELDASAVVQVINKRGCDVLGYTLDELVGKNWFDTAIPQEQVAAVKEAFESLVAGGVEQVEYYDNAVVARNGAVKHIAWHNVLLRRGEKVTGTLSSGIDITERKRSEDALAAEKERLDVTLRSIADGVITTDTSGVILVMNAVAEELTGFAAQEALGLSLKDVYSIFDGQTGEPLTNPLHRVLTGESPADVSEGMSLVARGGTRRIIAQSVAPIRGLDSLVMGAVLVFRDVSERHRLLEQTQRAERLDAIGILAGGIAHDFNNLLGGIFGYLCLAREQALPHSPQAVTLDEALQVFERARDLTRQLLTFAKGGAPVRSVIDLRKLLTDCTRFALSGSKVASHLHLASELPTVAADANQIWRVIDNLVRNAIQVMPRGGTLTITGDTVHLAPGNPLQLPGGTYVRVSVADNGPGIAPDILPRIFDPFFTTKEQGTGLGLATAYSVVKRHEGHIEVQSQLGVGTTFNIYLPATRQSSEDAAPAPKAMKHQGSGRALVLDDEPYLCRLFQRYLTRMGYEVTTVHNGHDAILAVDAAMVAGQPYKIALLDLTIPGGMGGKDVVSIVRPKCPALLTIAASGYSEDPVMAYPKRYGFDASLGKPFALTELEALLNALVQTEL